MTIKANRPSQELVDIVAGLRGTWHGVYAMVRWCDVRLMLTVSQVFRYDKAIAAFWYTASPAALTRMSFESSEPYRGSAELLRLTIAVMLAPAM